MTDKLREAAQQALGALIQADQRDGMYSYELEIAALRTALAQQDAQAATCKQCLQVDALLDEMLEAAPAVAQVPQGWKLVPVAPTPEMRKAAADAWIDCGDRLILNKAAAALRAGIAAAPTPPAQQDAQAVPQGWVWDCCIHSKGGWEVIAHFDVPIKVGTRLNAATTPPAQRVMLTDDEIDHIEQSFDRGWHHIDLARAVIEAYENKNGIK